MEPLSKEKVLDKVQKLLAMTSSTYDHEAHSALMLAQKLLAQYDLSMEDVPTGQQSQTDREVVEEMAYDVSAYNQWVRVLARVVAHNFRCEPLVSHRGNWFRMLFVGIKADATVASRVFQYAAKFAERSGANLAQTYNDKGLSCSGIKQDYINGFVTGLRKGWEKQVLECHECALMVLTPAVVTQHMSQYEQKSINVGYQASRGNSDAFRKGHESGQAFANLDGKKGIGDVE